METPPVSRPFPTVGRRVTVKIRTREIWEQGRYGSEGDMGTTTKVKPGESHDFNWAYSEVRLNHWDAGSLGWLYKLQLSLGLREISILSFWVGVGRSRLSPLFVTF